MKNFYFVIFIVFMFSGCGNNADNEITKTDDTLRVINIEGSDKKYSQLQDAVNATKEGDTIVLGNGLYKADVTVNTNNLTIKAATDAKNVVLSGDKPVVNWKYDSSKELYYAPSPCSPLNYNDIHDIPYVNDKGKKDVHPAKRMSGVDALFIKGEEKRASRYPNSGYLTVKESPSKSKFSLRNFNMTNEDMKDSVAHIRMSQWRLASRRVKSYAYGYINLESEAISDENTISPQYKVFFTQVVSAIDSNEEWAWNANKIYMKSDAEPQGVSVACSEYGIHLGIKVKKVTIDGLNITKIRGNGIDKVDDTRTGVNDDLIIKNNIISYVSGWGIKVRDFYKRYERLPADTTIQGNEIHHARTGGMRIFADNTLVDSNYVHDIGASKLDDDVLSFGDNFMLSGIFIANSSGAKVFNNRVNNTGYNGISLSNFWHGWMSNGGRIVENNYVSNAVLALNDGAGIYTKTEKTHDKERGVDPERDIIRNNIIKNSTGSFVATKTDYPEGEGIYLDNLSSYTDVIGNTVINATKSLYLHQNFEININNNTFISPNTVSILIGYAEDDTQDSENIFIKNNKIFSSDKLTYKIIFNSGQKYLTDSDFNIIRINSGTDVKIRRGDGLLPNVSLNQWNTYGYDEGSTIIKDSTKPVVLINPSLNNYVFNNLEGCRKFNNTSLDGASSTLLPYHSLVLFGCNNYPAGIYNKTK